MQMDGGRQEKIVWRCINRLDFGKKYCRNSPTVEESILQRAVMAAIMETAARNTEVLQTPKLHIGMGFLFKFQDNYALRDTECPSRLLKSFAE